MRHLGKSAFHSGLFALTAGAFVVSAHAQSTDQVQRERADDLAIMLAEGLPCTAAGTAGALEAKLQESLDTLADISLALEIMSNEESYCAEVRAAAGRQRLYIVQTRVPDVSGGDVESIGTPLSLGFEMGPPPLNVLRGRSGQR